MWVTTATTVRAANPLVPVPARAARRGAHKLQRNRHRARAEAYRIHGPPGSIVDQSRVYFHRAAVRGDFHPLLHAGLSRRTEIAIFRHPRCSCLVVCRQRSCVRSIPLSVCHAHPARNMNCIVYGFRKRPADSSRRSAESVIWGRGTWRTRLTADPSGPECRS